MLSFSNLVIMRSFVSCLAFLSITLMVVPVNGNLWSKISLGGSDGGCLRLKSIIPPARRERHLQTDYDQPINCYQEDDTTPARLDLTPVATSSLIPGGDITNLHVRYTSGGETVCSPTEASGYQIRLTNMAMSCLTLSGVAISTTSLLLCPGDCPKGSITERRHLAQAAVVEALDESGDAYEKLVEKCADYEYQGHVVVDDHIMVVGVPSEPALEAGCPHVAAHATYDENPETPYRKEVLTWDDPSVTKQMLEDSLHVDNFPLADLVRAHERVDPTRAANGGKDYDIISNNCGNYVLDLASQLQVKVDATMVSFVSRRLVEKAGKELAQKIRSSVNFFSLFPGRNLRGVEEDAVSDEDVIQALVETRASQVEEIFSS